MLKKAKMYLQIYDARTLFLSTLGNSIENKQEKVDFQK